MSFFIFNSKTPIKGKITNFYQEDFEFSEFDFLLDSEVRGFATSLFYSYLEFLLFKLKSFFKKTGPVTLNRKYYCINKYFKHILVVEWGFYDNRIFGLSSEVFHSCTGLPYYRPYSIPEYECSERDLKNPLHKTNYHRFCGSSHYQPPYEELTPRFFFNFFVLIPVSTSGFVRIDRFDTDGREFDPPMKLNFPILFEFFLLKFDIFSFLLSNSLSSIYEFFSLGYLKSIAIYFRNILFLIKKYYFNSIFNYDSFTDDDICLLKLKSSFSNLLNFYSFKCFNSKYYLSSNFYKNMLKESEFYHLDGKMKTFNFILKNLFFFIFFCYVYNCFLLNSVEILYSFNLLFS